MDALYIDVWAQAQTLNPTAKSLQETWYTGFEKLECSWFDLGIDGIPLDQRYASFKRRLAKALADG